jgi:hypothetical protein
MTIAGGSSLCAEAINHHNGLDERRQHGVDQAGDPQ